MEIIDGFILTRGIRVFLIKALGIFMALFLFYTAGFGQFPLPWQRGLTFCIAVIMIILKFPPTKKAPAGKVGRLLIDIFDLFWIAVFSFSTYYIIRYAVEIAWRMGSPSLMGEIICVLGILTVLEITRRSAPPALFYFSIAAICYGLFGYLLPPPLGHIGFRFGAIVQLLFFSYDGVYGVALGVMVGILFVFFLFGALLEKTGAGNAIVNIAYSLTGRMRGGPALSSIIASSLFGVVSGSAVANAVGTGTFTIPLMKKMGYTAEYAAAVEATASTGGMIMPPVMGTAAFLMSEILGIPYIRICAMALIPAVLYYLCIFISVYLQAWKRGLKGLSTKELPNCGEVFKKNWQLLFPILVLLLLLIRGFTPGYAAFYSIIVLAVTCAIYPHSRQSARGYLEILETSAINSLSIWAALAAVGIIIGVIALTGVGVTFSNMVVAMAGGRLLMALILIMVVSLIMGLAVSPVACYLLLITTAGMALEMLGVRTVVIHMYVFYFGVLASITPPVAMACYATAGIANSDVMKTCIIAVRLGIVGFIIPYMFVYGNELLLLGAPWQIILAFISSAVGVCALSIAGEGYFYGQVAWWKRLLLATAALMCIYPGFFTDLVGYVVIILLLAQQFFAGYRSERIALSDL